MSIINGVGRVGIRNYVSPVQSSYLLDTYGGAATAYSLRKLSSTYAGFAIRVRRSSDNTEQNIGFDGSGNLDTTALLAFVGSGDGFVTTWYDQSTAVKTMIQPTATSQPTIVSAGSLISRNGKPIIKFNSTNHLYMINNGSVSFDSSNHSFFMTYEKDSMTNKAILIRDDYSYLFLDYNTAITNGNNGFTINGYTIIPVNSFKLISLTNTWTTSRKFYMNNSVIGVLSGSSAGGCSFATIASPSYTQGTIYTNEVVTYPTDQVSNIDSINSNINSYYSIYPTYTSRTTAFAAATGITDTTILNALNTFDVGLISNGLDSKLHLFRPLVGGTSTTTRFNFMDTSLYMATHNGGITYDVNYIQGNGVNAYVNENFNILAKASLNNFGFGYYALTNNVSYPEIGAVNEYYRGAQINPNYGGNSYLACNGDYNVSSTNINTTKSLISLSRNGGNTYFYQNGIEKANFANSNSLLVNLNMYSMARNENGGGPVLYSTQRFGCVYLDKGLTLTELTTFKTLVLTLMTSLGR